MFKNILMFTLLFLFNEIYSTEIKTKSLTLEGFDDFNIAFGLNKNKLHSKVRLGLGYTREKYHEYFRAHRINTALGFDLGLLKKPKESIEITPTIGINLIAHFDWMSVDDDNELNYSYEFGPNASLTFYKLFDSFIIGGSVNVFLFTFERTENDEWNSVLNVSFKPHFIIGYRF